MESFAFVGVLAVLVVALHLVVAAYLYRVASGDGEASLRVETELDDGRTESTDQATDEDDTSLPCPTCGTPNDPDYQFCRRCVADLSSVQRVSDEAAVGRLGS